MNMRAFIPAFISSCSASACIYLSTRHQRWLRCPLTPRTALSTAGLCLVCAQFFWMKLFHPVTALFVTLTLIMAACIALPVIGALTGGPADQTAETGFRRDWLSKSLAGTVGGLGLGIALSGLFAWFGPGGFDLLNKFQLTMWLVAPIWMGVLSLCFLFPSGRQAWAWLGGANLFCYLLFYTGRFWLS